VAHAPQATHRAAPAPGGRGGRKGDYLPAAGERGTSMRRRCWSGSGAGCAAAEDHRCTTLTRASLCAVHPTPSGLTAETWLVVKLLV
jgi:hypothetical protein